jgi:hypothetical protein
MCGERTKPGEDQASQLDSTIKISTSILSSNCNHHSLKIAIEVIAPVIDLNRTCKSQLHCKKNTRVKLFLKYLHTYILLFFFVFAFQYSFFDVQQCFYNGFG